MEISSIRYEFMAFKGLLHPNGGGGEFVESGRRFAQSPSGDVPDFVNTKI
jgi:hypothetical protein